MKPDKIYDFNTDLKTGKIGEKDLIELILNSGKAIGYKDVSDDKRYQYQEIDILQINEHDNITYEVKTDRQGFDSRNISLEMTSYNKTGAFPKCKADYIYYVFVDSKNNSIIKERYLIDTHKMRIYIGEIVTQINVCNDFWLTYVNSNDSNGCKIGGINLLMNVDRLLRDSNNKLDYNHFIFKITL